MGILENILGFSIVSVFGNIFIVAIFIVIIGVTLGRQLFSTKGLVIISSVTLLILGSGSLYRYLSEFKGPGFSFYDNNETLQVNICNIYDRDTNTSINFKNHECANDEAASIKLLKIKKGTLIQLFDSPDGSLNDDWAEIYVKKDIEERMITTFETTDSDDEIELYYSEDDGLNGKVSRVSINHNAKPSSTIALYEGNDLTQNKVCELYLNSVSSINFKEKENYGCENDEAKSARIRNIPPKTRIQLFDDPDGSYTKNWIDIITFKSVDLLDIPRFELNNDIVNDKYLIQFHHDGNGKNIDGKISRIQITHNETPEPLAFFYEGNSGTQNIVKVITLSQSLKTQLKKSENDEARSVILYNAPDGKLLSVYDSPNASKKDDWTEIYVKKSLTKNVINSFERDIDKENYEVHSHFHDNLDGKISYISVSNAKPLAFVELFEGEKCTQNRVCSLPVNYGTKINFKNTSQCQNDEAKSMRLHRVPEGTVIYIFDDPNGSTKDDWIKIEVKKEKAFLDINSFEQTFHNENLDVTYFKKNKLNGKVSSIEFKK